MRRVTSRNIGQLQFLDEERRVGVTVLNWNLLTNVSNHARIFVARNTHGLYASPGVKALQPFTPDDPGTSNCGKVESLDESMSSTSTPPPADYELIAIILAKTLTIFPIPWLIAEFINGSFAEPFGSAPSADPQLDHPPDDGVYGVVVKPFGLILPDGARAQREVPWFIAPGGSTPGVDGATHAMTIGGRSYSFMVDRRETDPAKRQAWWPSDGVHIGYDGRWGARVTNDPRGRRAGMRFPNFAELFLRALQQALSKP